MNILKPPALQVVVNPYYYEQQHFLCVTAMLMFDFNERKYHIDTTVFWKTIQDNLGDDIKIDNYLPKESGCFFASGYCYSYDNDTNQSHATIKIGNHSKTVMVFGDRRRLRKDLYQATTKADYFDKIALGYENSFGGPGYPNNPLGKGYTENEAEELLLPNTELPNNDRTPAHFLPVYYDPRLAESLTRDDFRAGQDWPHYRRDFNGQRLMNIPEDQVLSRFLRRGEPYVIEHMNPTERIITGRLPDEVLRGFYRKSASKKIEELPLDFSNIWFFPHEEKGLSVFHGLLHVENFTSDPFEFIQFEIEPQPTPYDGEHYHRQWIERYSKLPAVAQPEKTGFVHRKEDPPDFSETEKQFKQASGLNEEEQSPEIRTFLKQMKQARPQDMADIVNVYMTHSLNRMDKKELDAIGTVNREQPPPKPRDLEAIKNEIKQMKLPDEQQDMIFKEMQVIQNSQTRLLSLQLASTRDPNHPRKATITREEVIDLHAKKIPIKDQCLAALDLSDLNLSGIQLSHCDLVQTNFNRSIVTDANLEHCFFEETSIDAADFSKSDLSYCILRSLNGTRTNLSKCRLEQASIEQCTFQDAFFLDIQSDHYTVFKTVFNNCYFNRLESASCSFVKSECIACDFSKSQLNLTTFVDCRFDKALLQQCHWQSCQFVNHRFINTTFKESSVTQTTHTNCEWQQVTIQDSDFSQNSFTKCVVKDCRFIKSNLNRFEAVNSQLDTIAIEHCDMTNSRFAQQSLIHNIHVTSCVLPESSLIQTELRHVDFKRCDLSRTQFNTCDITDMTLTQSLAREIRYVQCHIRSSTFERTDLLDAIIIQNQLSHCQFLDSNLFGANFNYCQKKNTITRRCIVKEVAIHEDHR
ncbi:DUF2169 family type VI secretion system accessory protein [Legionella spiritensis]|uniref:Pentapeptide repeats (8 copies) n=1 Tax=Legionella spiritensis TaxID=452 RepID=A0A0W0Z9L8_LEGSP|nr:DUF2169 domain-containing protein [Legionella spiritensis]KTD65737.1 Pentapeptide repeats (8 copies) [Legionella spiritensis]SNV42804.1 secreted effector protein PipB2 [Legionella spiritensis]